MAGAISITTVLEALLKYPISESIDSELSQNALTLIKIYQSELQKETQIPYDLITEFVFNSSEENSTELNEILNINLDILSKNASGSPEELEKMSDNIEKIRRHYSLAYIQKDYISRITKDTRNMVEDLVPVAKTLKDQTEKTGGNLKEIQKEINLISETKSSIYTDFIAILGVFSAFVFLMFGGVDVLKSVFDVADNLETVSMKRLVIIGSMMIITLLTLMYSLLLWVSRITNKDFGQNCFHKDCKDGCIHKIRHCLHRHTFYFGLLALFVIIIIFANLCLK